VHFHIAIRAGNLAICQLLWRGFLQVDPFLQQQQEEDDDDEEFGDSNETAVSPILRKGNIMLCGKSRNYSRPSLLQPCISPCAD
jgi:hypothetical protein